MTLNLNVLVYIFFLILFFVIWYTNFQKRLNFFVNFHVSLLRKILEALQFFQYTKFYETMEDICIDSLYRSCLLAAIMTMRLLILNDLYGDESLISIFHFLCKAMVSFYYSCYLPFISSKKILSCSLRFIKF